MKNDASGEKMNRRRFIGRLILGGAGLALAGAGLRSLLSTRKAAPPIPGEIVGANAKAGHRLRAQSLFQPQEQLQTKVLIVGAGIAGLSAARALQRAGIHDYFVLDLEQAPGGNSSFGRNDLGAYPWGAHYLPIPDPRNESLITLLEELGVIRQHVGGKPWYDEAYLCHAPHERLFLHGSWQEGLLPRLGVPDDEWRQIQEFQAAMAHWQHTMGADGKPLFAIPVAQCSDDPQADQLDQHTMEAWMQAQGWTSPHLHTYVDYCCRDDFGTTHSECSAWAGIHYFAARSGIAANAGPDDVLTWPEGNGWLAAALARISADRILPGHLATGLRNTDTGVEADVIRLADGRNIRIHAQAAIYAGPRFTAERVVEGLSHLEGFTYAPWAVANITLRKRPAGRGAPLSWDNVAHGGRSLGYILADHQHLAGHARDRCVITWYEPLTDLAPQEARKAALARTHADWCDYVLEDLERMHAGIRAEVERLDVWVWGHGMIRPVPGFIRGKGRAEAAAAHGRIFFAHSDLSGISIFEEAFHWGNEAAEAVRKLSS